MATNGPVSVQGCAYRIARLNADGSINASSVGMIQDDRPLVKLECKPVLQAGVEITPISACGVPVISYKDCDRYKRWEVTLTLGDWDPEQMELVAGGALLTGTGSPGRTFTDGVTQLNENLVTSASATFTIDDVGRAITDAGFFTGHGTVATGSANITALATPPATIGVQVGMLVSGNHIPAGAVVIAIVSSTEVTMSVPATGAGAAETITFHTFQPNAYVTEFVSATQVRISSGALHATPTTGSFTLGAQPVSTIGYQYPRLLLVDCPFGVSIEVWSKLIVRGTGCQGTTPYPSAGTADIPGSAYLRTGVFRSFLWHDAIGIENKEQTPMFKGWAIENPNFGTGPADDWRESGIAGTGPALSTVAWCDQMADFKLPAPLQPGYQTTA